MDKMTKSPLDKFLVGLPPIQERIRIALNIDRKEAIYKILKDWAYKINGYYLISFWDLAYRLNDSWFTYLFIRKYTHKDKIIEYHKKWALSEGYVYILKTTLNCAVKRLKGKVITRGYNVYYKMKI